MPGKVTEAVLSYLERLPGDVSGAPEAALALALAELVDDQGSSATSKSMNAGRMLDALERVRALAPEKAEVSPLDEIRARRDKRLGKSGAAG